MAPSALRQPAQLAFAGAPLPFPPIRAKELKLLRDRHTLPEGLEQVARYARRLGRDRGHLILFDTTSEQPWDDRGQVEEVLREGVTVVVVRA